MEHISIHISKLLFDNSKVIVNGLGYFQANEQKAYHHPVNHNFSPKSKVVSFRLDKNAKGDLLEKALGDVDATLVIDKFAKRTIKDLIAGKKVVLSNLGTLSKHEKGHVVFVQDKDFVFDKDFFGMEDFIQQPVKVIEPLPVVKPIPVEEKKSNKMFIWIAITGLVASLIIAFVFLRSNDNAVVEKNIAKHTVVEPIVSADAVSAVAVSAEKDSVSNEEPVVASDAVDKDVAHAKVDSSVDLKIEAPKGNFYVMAGCFKSSYKAKKYLKELRGGNYPNASIKGVTASGLIRVCYSNFDTEAAAEQFMLKVSQEENKELWMQQIEE